VALRGGVTGTYAIFVLSPGAWQTEVVASLYAAGGGPGRGASGKQTVHADSVQAIDLTEPGSDRPRARTAEQRRR
jgi:hypothetical protein